MSPRDVILARVQAALAPLPKRAPLPEWERELTILRQARGAVDLEALFKQRLLAVNGRAISTAAELWTQLREGGWLHGYCDPRLLPLLGTIPEGFSIESRFERERVDDYHFGITAADAGIAETGTLVLTDAGTPRRLAALAPWVHVAVVSRRALFADLPQAVAALGKDRAIVWCTGPSKTADVEGILIEGVHGPGVEIAWLVD